MATKEGILIINGGKISYVNDNHDNQFTNLNLNQNSNKISSHSQMHSQSVLETVKFPSAYQDGGNTVSNRHTSFASSLTSAKNSYGVLQKQKAGKIWKKDSSKGTTANSTTLSLHITAYENSIEASSGGGGGKATTEKPKKWKKAVQQIFTAPTIATGIEFPRQQREDLQVPEVMRYKTSQKLFNANEDRRIPREKRLKAMEMLNAGETIADVSKELEISTFGVRYIRDRVFERKELGNREIGQRVLTDEQTTSFILQHLEQNRNLKTRELHQLLKQHGIELSVDQLRYRITALGFAWKKMHRVQVISYPNRLKRLNARAFWEAEEYPFSRYLFVDESTVVLGRVQQWCWVPKGEKTPCQGRVRHGEGFHVFGGISWFGATDILVWRSKHRMNSSFYCANNLQDVVLQASTLFPGGQFELAQDNHGAHTSRYTLEYLKNAGIPTFDWPPQSPDWNPIEFVWRDLKEYIAARVPTSLDELHDLIREFWSTMVTPAYCRTSIRLAIRNVKRSFDGLNHEKDFPRETVYEK